MKRRRKLICLAAALCLLLSLLPAALAAEDPGDGPLAEKSFDELCQELMDAYYVDPEKVSFGYYNTVTGETHYHRPDEYMDAASMFKVPINMLFAERVAEGEMDWDTKIAGVPYEKALRMTIINSDNKMAEHMWNYVGGYQTYRQLICPYMGVDKETVEAKYWENNFFTARQMIHCLKTLYENPDRFPRIVDTMLEAEPEKYFKLHEQSVKVAHKYGYNLITNQILELNDCAICYTDDPICIVLFTEGIKNQYAFLTEFCTLMCEYTQTQTAKRLEEARLLAEQEAIRKLNEQTESGEKPAAETAAAIPLLGSSPAIELIRNSSLPDIMTLFLIVAAFLIALIAIVGGGRKRQIKPFWAVLAALCAAAALFSCVLAPNMETAVSDDPVGDPRDSVTGFFDALEAREFEKAYSFVGDYASYGLETRPESEAAQLMYDALLDSYSCELYGDCQIDGLSARQQVLLQALDLTLLQDDLKERTEALVQEACEDRPRSEFLDENGDYRSEITDAAYLSALRELLSQPEKYVKTVALWMNLSYSAEGWRINTDSRLLGTLSGGVMSGKGGEKP
ncbi:MAG: class A beta-lactamase-related serine hydrolase [Oscillospiraceae bacterium]|nr:class A beta-lactamase-related serine hydrolase [Oscillospiraceae bacterium]